MILHFPNLDLLRLALTSNAVPDLVRASSAHFAFAADHSLWMEPASELSVKAVKELQKLGVQFPAASAIHLSQRAADWLQVFPLTRDRSAVHLNDKTPVLFVLPRGEQLAELVAEMLRLGNDRQSFRWLDDGECTQALLRVFGPPYYSLLRALDHESLKAFREIAPRLWVQIGYTYPLAEHVRPPEGQLLLLQAPHQWTFVPEAKWRDIYEVIDFPLAHERSAWHDHELPAPIRVPVKLTRSGGSEAAELWLLREDGIAQLEELVRSSDNALLARLAFAVGEKDGERIVILRVRPSRNAPPVLVLDGLAMRSYLRIANLFVPVGMSLSPPLRRDAVVKLLADERERITFLVPNPDHTFTPESLPDQAFRPLSAWIDYVLEHEQQAMHTWIGASQFDFESFVCRDEQPKAKKPASPKPPKKRPEKEADAAPSQPPDVIVRKSPQQDEPVVQEAQVEPGELAERLRAQEAAFGALKTPLDDPQRVPLWREMAELNGALHHHADAAVCWSNALWEQPRVEAQWPQTWYALEAKQPIGQTPTAGQILRLVSTEPTTHAKVRQVIAYLIGAAALPKPPADLLPHLNRMQQFLEKHEGYLGVRAVWLAWHALHQLSGSDVLTLARARDRLLERLFLHGLSPELDLPGFLRFAGLQESNRFRMVRDQVVRLRQQVQEWAQAGANPTTETLSYIDLIFAFGLARLGERHEAQQLRQAAFEQLANADEVHSWLYEAFEFRVQQALDGKPGVERLPEKLLQQLDALEHPDFLQHVPERQRKEAEQTQRMLRLKIDRLREKSRILEPLEKIDAYRRWHRGHADELTRELIGLVDIHDRGELIERLHKLLGGKQKFKGVLRPEGRILMAALDLAPRLGQSFGEEVLDRVPAQLAKLKDAEESAVLLEKSIFLAAHYDRKEDVQRCVAQFHQLLQNATAISYEKLVPLMARSFRTLRKFGLRDLVAQLMKRLEEMIAADAGLRPSAKGRADNLTSKRLGLLLELASGWFFFGEENKARGILDEARTVLLKKELASTFQAEVACAYLTALSQAPMEFALARIMEFYRKVEGVYDNYTTNSHYSLSRLMVVEATMLALISDDFTLDHEARQRIDEDEFLVRRRIHRDMRDAMAQAGM